MLKEINTKTINVDINNGSYDTPSYYQHETSGILIINFKNGEEPLNLSSITAINIYLKKPDKTISYIDGKITDATNGVVEFELSNNDLASVGLIKASVLFYEGEKTNKFSPKFNIMCKDSEYDEAAIVSTNEFSALQEAIIEAKTGGVSVDTIKSLILEMIANGDLQVESYDDITIRNMIGTLSNLTTTDKTSLVNAINELKDEFEQSIHTHSNKSVLDKFTYVNNKLLFNGESITGGTSESTSNVLKVYNVLNYGITTDSEDNTPELQTLVDAVNSNGGGIIYFPNGTYNFKKAVNQLKYAIAVKSNVSIIGENIEKTVLKCSEAVTYSLFAYLGANKDTPLTGCTYSNFTVDAYSTGNVNKVYGKVFFYQYVKNCVFRDLILKGTIATAMGIDYLDNVLIDNVNCIDCGRTFENPEKTSGTSGIGIGSGGFENENFKIVNCTCVNCGQYGIFVENQYTQGWGGNYSFAKGTIIANNIVRNGLYRGIGVRGGKNLTVIGNETYENKKDGIYLDSLCENVKILNNSSNQNGDNGIYVKTITGSTNSSKKVVIAGNTVINNSSDGIKTENTGLLTDIVIRDNTILNNSAYGINVLNDTNGLSLIGNYTKGNNKGLYINFNSTHTDSVIKNNVFFDESKLVGSNSWAGTTTFNDLSSANIDSDSGSTTTYTITKNLTNVNINNSASSIEGGRNYNATLTPKDGYTLKTVKVKMGGTDITSTSYSNGAISITNVTGNIEITANATATVVTYTVTNNLTNVTNSSPVTSVNKNSSYSATLTPSDGYTLDSVTVTMGGADITSTSYSNGTVSISSVTGNIVITASATQSASTTTYTVTNNLTNATNSNTAISVDENSSYNATISAVTGYTLNTVTVTMGDTDISSSAVSGGNISISSVTGNIVITATATAQSSGSGTSYTLPSGLIKKDLTKGIVVTSENNTINVKTTKPLETGYSINISDSTFPQVQGFAGHSLLSKTPFIQLTSGKNLTMKITTTDKAGNLSSISNGSILFKDSSGTSISETKIFYTDTTQSTQTVTYTASSDIELNYLLLYIPNNLPTGMDFDIKIEISVS